MYKRAEKVRYLLQVREGEKPHPPGVGNHAVRNLWRMDFSAVAPTLGHGLVGSNEASSVFAATPLVLALPPELHLLSDQWLHSIPLEHGPYCELHMEGTRLHVTIPPFQMWKKPHPSDVDSWKNCLP